MEDLLKKFLAEHPRDWDQLLPYLLFALREVPNESTKLSPSELVYRRKTRGLLALARETWTNGCPTEHKLNMSTAKYVEGLNRRIETALRAAGDNFKEVQSKMKEVYDKTSTVRKLQPGELVLDSIAYQGQQIARAMERTILRKKTL